MPRTTITARAENGVDANLTQGFANHPHAGRDEADASVTWSPTICTRAENGVDANLTQGFANYPHARAENGVDANLMRGFANYPHARAEMRPTRA